MRDEPPMHKFSADRPIDSRKEDLLDRSAFADSLASAIKGWSGKDSLVISIYGKWGEGKSSLKNMILDSLEKSKNGCPQIVEFNPWQWASQDQLAKAFFREIEIVLGKKNKSEEQKRLAKLWRGYGAYLKAGSFLADSLKNGIIGLLSITLIIGVYSSFIGNIWIYIVFILAVIAAIFKWGVGFIENIASIRSVRSETSQQTLKDFKKELSLLLLDREAPILIVIDDIDRLTPDEIKLLFQLIKANADFPNLIYLLLFQRNIVEEGLVRANVTDDGREYLEKIVQVGFDIPKAEDKKIKNVLFTGLDGLLLDQAVRKRFDEGRWANIFMPGLGHYFKTLRDVYRFLSTLDFHVALFRKNGSFEVNPIDLIALEVLRVFEPEVYHMIPQTKSALTKQQDHWRGLRQEEQIRTTVNSIVEKASQDNRQQVTIILKQLFPPAGWVFDEPNFGPGFEETWLRELRVCHPNIFDRYFQLIIPEGDISQGDIDRMISLIDNRESFANELRAFNQRGLLEVALNRLEVYLDEIEIKHAIPFITALFDVGDELPEKPPGLFGIGPDMQASRIIRHYLKRIEDSKERSHILKTAIKSTTGLYLPVYKISIEDSRQEREKDPSFFVIADEDLNEIIQLCVEKIKEAAESGTLKSHREMLYLLLKWQKWSSPEESKKWVEELIESPDGLLNFFKSFLQEVTSEGAYDYAVKIHWRINLKLIEKFVSIDVLEKKIKQIKIEDLEERGQLAIREFQKALKRRKEGKPDEYLWGDLDDYFTN